MDRSEADRRPGPVFGMERLVLSPMLGLGLAAGLGASLLPDLFPSLPNAAGIGPGIAAALWKWAPLIGQGFLMNLLISVLAMAIGTAAGLPLGLAGFCSFAPLRRAAWLFIQFFRNAPWLVLLFSAILTLPYEVRIGGLVVPLPAWIKATLGLALPVMANIAEILRGAIQSLPAGQWEAADALALSRGQVLRLVILPQCLTRMLPPWMNLYAVLTMATPLVSVVGVEEAMTLTRSALSAENRSELLLPMHLMLMLLFFLYCYPIARWTGRLERRFAVKT